MTDAAVWDHARWDYARWDVKKPVFDEALEALKRITSSGGLDPAICGSCRSGYCRSGVYVSLFDEAKTGLERSS